MDPYIDFIPHDCGKEIRKRVREQDSSNSLIKRARADTNPPLPQEDDDQEVEEPPKPKANLDKSAHDRMASASTATSTPYPVSVSIATSTSNPAFIALGCERVEPRVRIFSLKVFSSGVQLGGRMRPAA